MGKMKLKTLPRMLSDESPKFVEATELIYKELLDVENIPRKDIIKLTLTLLFSHGFIAPGVLVKFSKSLREDQQGYIKEAKHGKI